MRDDRLFGPCLVHGLSRALAKINSNKQQVPTVFVVHRVLNIIDHCEWKSTALKISLPFLGRELGCFGLDHTLQDGPISNPLIVAAKPLVVFPLRFSKLLAQDAKETVVGTPDENIAIRRFEALVGDNRCYNKNRQTIFFLPALERIHLLTMRRAPSSRILLAADQDRTSHVGQRRHLAVTQTHV